MINELESVEVVRCPVCGNIINDGENGIDTLACEHIVMVYADCCSEFCYVANKKYGKIADKIMDECNSDVDSDSPQDVQPADLMEAYAEKNGYDMYSITTSGIACGPVSNTDYYMIKFPKVKRVKKSKKAKK